MTSIKHMQVVYQCYCHTGRLTVDISSYINKLKKKMRTIFQYTTIVMQRRKFLRILTTQGRVYVTTFSTDTEIKSNTFIHRKPFLPFGANFFHEEKHQTHRNFLQIHRKLFRVGVSFLFWEEDGVCCREGRFFRRNAQVRRIQFPWTLHKHAIRLWYMHF